MLICQMDGLQTEDKTDKSKQEMTEKVLYDCDNTLGLPLKEVDDGLTILYLLGIHEVELLGITTTFGNGTIDQVYDQTKKWVKRSGLSLPVLRGEGAPHDPPDTPAAQFLKEQVNRYPHEITILATGPLGNLHAAAKLDPDFYKKVKRIFIMGGYLKSVKLGYRDLKELNLSANSPASFDVLTSTCPITLFPAQVCLDAPYRLADIWGSSIWPVRYKLILTQWLFAFGFFIGEMVFYLWDLLPAVYLTAPECFTVEPVGFCSSLQDLQSGMLVFDPEIRDPSLSLATKIADLPHFYHQLEKGWLRALQNYKIR